MVKAFSVVPVSQDSSTIAAATRLGRIVSEKLVIRPDRCQVRRSLRTSRLALRLPVTNPLESRFYYFRVAGKPGVGSQIRSRAQALRALMLSCRQVSV